MFIFHCLTDIPPTYRGIALCLLQQLCNMSERVDFVGDQYISPSVKIIETQRRGQSDMEYQISGPEQSSPSDWQNSLKGLLFTVSVIGMATSSLCTHFHWSQCVYDSWRKVFQIH